MSSEELKKLKLKAQIWITSVLGFFAMGIVVFEPSDSSLVKWAIGVLGIIIGYWLK